jgi:predicted nucleic acid-binding protein
MARVFVDTSAIYALIDRDDAEHSGAKSRLRALKKARVEPVLTNFVVAETHALLLARLGASVARAWLVRNVWHVERATEADESAGRRIIAEYVDKTFSFTDAVSFAVMERLGMTRAFAFDRHFEQYGLQLV